MRYGWDEDALGHVSHDAWTMIASDVLLLELNATPDQTKRERLLTTAKLAKVFFNATALELRRAEQIETFGFRGIDALHLACAEAARAEMFLSVDRGLINAAARNRSQLKVPILNPVDFVLKVSEQ